ncbi:cupin domain protein [bacterium BMS3Abin14]|nr:cupin domain protein [bacterium BMS3Abin14]
MNGYTGKPDETIDTRETVMQSLILDCRSQIVFSDEKANKIPIAESDRSRVNLWCLGSGQHIHPHVHDGDHIWVILEGKGTFFGEENTRKEVGPDTVLFLPAGSSHGIENAHEEGLVFLSISAG